MTESTTVAEATTVAVATQFDLATGLAESVPSLRRPLSAMTGMYADTAAFEAAVADGDPLTYEFYDMGVPAVAPPVHPEIW